MGNKKNKHNNRNTHRRGMQKRWHAEKYKKLSAKRFSPSRSNDDSNPLDLPSSNPLDGSRIVNLNQLQNFITELSAHAAQW